MNNFARPIKSMHWPTTYKYICTSLIYIYYILYDFFYTIMQLLLRNCKNRPYFISIYPWNWYVKSKCLSSDSEWRLLASRSISCVAQIFAGSRSLGMTPFSWHSVKSIQPKWPVQGCWYSLTNSIWVSIYGVLSFWRLKRLQNIYGALSVCYMYSRLL